MQKYSFILKHTNVSKKRTIRKMSKRQFSPLIRSIFRPCIRIFQNDGLLMKLKTQISPHNKLNIISLNKIFSIRKNSRFMANQDRICLQKKRFSAQEGIISEKKWDIPGKRCLSFLSNQGGFEGKDRLLSGKT